MPPNNRHGSKGKGKNVDKSTPWSTNKWDDIKGSWYVERFNSFGEVEYKYYNPDQAEELSESIPRTTGDATWSSDEQNQASNNTEGNYTTASGRDSGYDQSGYGNETEFLDAPYMPLSGDNTDAGPSNSSGFHIEDQSQFVASSFQGLSLSLSISPPILEEDPPYSQEQRIANAKKIRRQPNSKNYEELDDRYRVVEEKKQRSFWKIGRVFMMLWSEPARFSQQVPSNGGTRNGSHLSTVYLKGTVYSEIRRFVVISVGHGSNICSPIQTYSGQGTLKANLPEPDQHAIIYTGQTPPPELGYTSEDGTWISEDLVKEPVRVRSERKDSDGTLQSASRINYSKIYTVENYVRVLNIGMVHENSMASLLANCLVKPRPDPKPSRDRRKNKERS